jgi:short-subunit dehydrogenase
MSFDNDFPVALITGATSGIGAAFARRLADDGYNLIMHGRREELLKELADALGTLHRIGTEVLIAELGQPDGIRKVEDRIASLDRLDMLVNNAGYFQPGNFWELEPDDLEAMISTHVIAPVRFTRAALPGMMARDQGDIINISSLAAYGLGGHGLENYCATKRYLVTFTESLHVALAGKGIRLHVTAPGHTTSEFHSRMGLDPKQMETEGIRWMPAEEVVDQALHDLEQGKIVNVPGFKNKIMTWAAERILPRRLFYKFMIRRQYRMDSERDQSG